MSKIKLYKNYKSGFTLIEVLVVIFILGLITSVTLVSMNSIRESNAEHNIKAGISNMAIQIRVYYDRNTYYGNTTFTATTTQAACSTPGTVFADPLVYKSIVDAEEASDPSSNWVVSCALGKVSSGTTAKSWAVAVPLKKQNLLSSTSGVDYYCADSLGVLKIIDTINLSGGPSSPAKCR